MVCSTCRVQPPCHLSTGISSNWYDKSESISAGNVPKIATKECVQDSGFTFFHVCPFVGQEQNITITLRGFKYIQSYSTCFFCDVLQGDVHSNEIRFFSKSATISHTKLVGPERWLVQHQKKEVWIFFSPESFQQKMWLVHTTFQSLPGLMRSTVFEQLQQSLFGELVWAIGVWFLFFKEF